MCRILPIICIAHCCDDPHSRRYFPFRRPLALQRLVTRSLIVTDPHSFSFSFLHRVAHCLFLIFSKLLAYLNF